ncbi:expressed unknown protein [Seminavis robusta]|uniref:Uncharacterized protein n=1 Tax=Seminavis robusta TaxID=568900 RepID=A0A9N8H8R5_9STRA|nr:expressed unknown protein [Seminavis robusta]|eukprot:Sro249_g098650.1 n/a (206) ;mRNA; r:29357-30303
MFRVECRPHSKPLLRIRPLVSQLKTRRSCRCCCCRLSLDVKTPIDFLPGGRKVPSPQPLSSFPRRTPSTASKMDDKNTPSMSATKILEEMVLTNGWMSEDEAQKATSEDLAKCVKSGIERLQEEEQKRSDEFMRANYDRFNALANARFAKKLSVHFYEEVCATASNPERILPPPGIDCTSNARAGNSVPWTPPAEWKHLFENLKP